MTNNFTVPLPSFKFELIGDWNKARRYPALIKESMSRGYEEGTRVWAKDYLKYLVGLIGTHRRPKSSPWPITNYRYRVYGSGPRQPIKPSYWYFRAGALSRSIGIKKTGRGLIMVGLKNGRSSASAGGISLARAFELLQSGSTHSAWLGANVTIPARPMIEPALEDIGGRKRIKNIILREIKKQLFIRGIRATVTH